jgi:hypothetical protein
MIIVQIDSSSSTQPSSLSLDTLIQSIDEDGDDDETTLVGTATCATCDTLFTP